MAIVSRDFDTMVLDTLTRISNSTPITNTNYGSVIRTITESILAETDIQYYQLNQLFNAMGIDTATGEDLERLVAILGVTRKNATAAVDTVVFGRSDPATFDINIPYGNVISTLPDRFGKVIEFYVSQEGAVLAAGQLAVDVTVTNRVAGLTYVPQGGLSIMNTPIMNIEYVTNDHDIYGGSDAETDEELRARAKEALNLLGKGTIAALTTALKNIDGIADAVLVDMPDGIPGTVNAIVVATSIPTPPDVDEEVDQVIADTKAAGILVTKIYPDILYVDVTINTTGYTDADGIHSALVSYFSQLKVAETFVINQMERYVLNAAEIAGYPDADITTVAPTANVVPTGTQIIRSGTIIINGVIV